jgi:predicted transcriptional regulator
MATMTIRISDAKRKRLQKLAESQGVSVNQLVDQLSTIALKQFDAERRFRALAKEGDVKEGLALLDKLDGAFNEKS